MKWTAYIFNGALPLVPYSSEAFSWYEVPDLIAYVVVEFGTYSRRLQGFDLYYVTGNGYGVKNEAENADVYEGRQVASFVVVDGQEFESVAIPESAVFRAGVMLPDDAAREVGIL